MLKYLAADVALGLGTDGAAGSNNDLNLFEEIDLAAKMQKVTSMDPVALTAEQAFEMATIRGARALKLDKEIGSLEAGKRADLAFIRTDAPHAVPMFHVYSQLAYALKGSDVQHVFVNGRLVVRNRRLLTVDLPQVLAKAAEYQRAVAASVAPSNRPVARVLFHIPLLEVGGSEVGLFGLATRLPRDAFQPMIWCSERDGPSGKR